MWHSIYLLFSWLLIFDKNLTRLLLVCAIYYNQYYYRCIRSKVVCYEIVYIYICTHKFRSETWEWNFCNRQTPLRRSFAIRKLFDNKCSRSPSKKFCERFSIYIYTEYYMNTRRILMIELFENTYCSKQNCMKFGSINRYIIRRFFFYKCQIIWFIVNTIHKIKFLNVMRKKCMIL